MTLADSTFFDVFTFPLAYGNPQTALKRPNGAVLSAEAARQYFGTTQVVGRALSVKIGKQVHDVTVAAVTEPIPTNSSIQFTILLPATGRHSEALGSAFWGTLGPSTYVERAEGVSRTALDQRFSTLIGDVVPDGPLTGRFRLQSLTDVRHGPAVTGSQISTRDPRYLYMLAGIAVFILLIAAINFTTLTVARSTERAREVGVRKTIGARRGQLRAQFWSEAFLLCATATGLGLGLAALAHPLFRDLVSAPLPPIEWTNPVMLVLLAGLLVLVGLLSGSYPASYLSRFEPATVLRGSGGLGRPPRLVQGLVVLQFAVGIGLVVGTIVMVQQMDFLHSRSLGYDTGPVVRMRVPFEEGTDRWKQLRAAVANDTRIQHVAGSWNQLGAGNGVSFQMMPVAADGRSLGVQDEEDFDAMALQATPNIVETLDLEVIEGMSFAERGSRMGDEVVLVNRAFVEAAGWESPIGQRVSRLFGVQNAEVIGVVENFHVQSLHHQIQPLMITLDNPLSVLYARLAPGSIADGMDRLRAAWTETMPDLPFEYTFLDEAVEQQYRAEQRWTRTVRYGAGFALFIACLGLLGLAQLSARRRTQEIGLRKVLGASVSSIIGLLTRDFLKWVGIAFVLAAPVSYWALQRWLQNFAYRIDLGPGLYLLAGGLIAGVAFVTVGLQAWRAARIDPATTLRDE